METRPKLTTKELELLFKEHYTFLCLVSLAIVKDKDISKDVVQDFFVSFWEKSAYTTINTTFKSYAVRAVKNLSLLSLEKVKKSRTFIENTPLEVHCEQESWEEARKDKSITELLTQLPPSRREIFESSVLHGQSYSAIAEANGISINTVKTQIKRAYSYLRAHANEYMGLDPFSVKKVR